jgi:hypothetical protein
MVYFEDARLYLHFFRIKRASLLILINKKLGGKHMTINHEHQLIVLKDLLSDHQADRSGTVSECEQIERLAKSLMANDAVHSRLKNTLSDIYTYSQNGKNATDLSSHIEEHEQQLAEWMNELT